MTTRTILTLCIALVACGSSGNQTGDGATGTDGHNGGGDGGNSGGYMVYAHSDNVLYTLDLQSKALVTVGPFDVPGSGAITDLAVAPSGVIYVITGNNLYSADATTGKATLVGSLDACGVRAAALTTTPDGSLWTGDNQGALCKIDTTTSPPTVGAPVMMGNGMALAGDLIAVDDGTVFGTAYDLSDQIGIGTQVNNVLVKVELTTGAVTRIGATGYPELFGVAFQQGKVFGFTHDGTGRVVTIDTTTGAGTLFGTFTDPLTSQGIGFAGAGVSPLVSIL